MSRAPNRMWHDDVRRPPDDTWHWVRTNHEAIWWLLLAKREWGAVEEVSLDHDLGLEDVDPNDVDAVILRGVSPDGDGVDLCYAMYYLRVCPPKVTIHSMNPDGASRMADICRNAGAEVTVREYQPS